MRSRSLTCGPGWEAEQLPAGDVDMAKVEPILAHLRWLLRADEEPKAFDYMLSWLADVVKGNRPQTMVIWYSRNFRTGKGIFLNWFIKRVLGVSAATQVDGLDKFQGSFNGWRQGKAFINIDELAVGSAQFRAQFDKLKNALTEPFFFVNEKHKPAFLVPSIHSIVGTTNSADSVPHMPGRTAHFRTTEEKKSREYYKKLGHHMEAPGVADHFLSYLMSWPESNPDRYTDFRAIPHTQFTAEREQASLPAHVLFFKAILAGDHEAMPDDGSKPTQDVYLRAHENCRSGRFRGPFSDHHKRSFPLWR